MSEPSASRDETKPSTICRHCERDIYVHMSEGKCPFEASSFEAYTMGEIVDRTLEHMGAKEIGSQMRQQGFARKLLGVKP